MTRKLKPRPRYGLDVKALDDRIIARHENTFRALAEAGNRVDINTVCTPRK